MNSKVTLSSKSNKIQLFQYVMLLLAVAIVGCSSNDDTATLADKDRRDGGGNNKPTQTSNRHFAHDSLGALINVGLLNLERATEIAIKEAAATHFETGKNKSNPCQQVSSSVSGLVKTVTLTTSKNGCEKTRAFGNETFILTTENGKITELTTKLSDKLHLPSAAPKSAYVIKQKTKLEPSTKSASSNAYDFTSTTNIYVEILENKNRPREAAFTIEIAGTAVISKTTGLMTAVAIEQAQVYVERQDKTGSQVTSADLTLTPEDTDFVALTCGRFEGRMKFKDTVSLANFSSAQELNGTLVFSANSVQDAADAKITSPVAKCAAGVVTLEADILELTKRTIKTLVLKRSSAREQQEPISDEE